MLLFIVILGVLVWLAFQQIAQKIYLEQAQARADLITETVENALPTQWKAFLANTATPSDLAALDKVFQEEALRRKLTSLRVFDPSGAVIYDSKGAKTPAHKTSAALSKIIAGGGASASHIDLPSGDHFELYVPHRDESGALLIVFELFEPASYSNELLIRTAVPAIAVPAILLLGLLWILRVLVLRAQGDIDRRTSAIAELSHRLETFVSSSALDAAKAAHGADGIASKNITCTLFHSDVRDFTSLAETNSPQDVVSFLNDLMTVQVEIVAKHGGDVDKMIGDALLVRFEGPERERRAISAARDILNEARLKRLARGVGVGIYSGEVISGAIGPRSRRDFTVIGDSVNIAARLCSNARKNELIVDTQTAARADIRDFGPPDKLAVKGRNEPLTVHRWTARQPDRPR
ncbi:adenylate/guanylate cyclase domain-containing protein [Varunaivibrio sulfuroxidans]|uniref:Class 3 adenylate cyclase n=1 Tax=Varunaivibrio sulfuroxidans TaxID=1773489 RepID=A0A4R3JG71_9PROT|nr:adenylate/guanylate cyclase domain-containing protein [Varunaivibrio sulfuroxidans]TCS64914.1 class 3 adenylate cyclase [Varunaivibrio sulfuroxidans]WES29792.1 adenylate/guanylate cyclase domain-containing protein [Varunaivibrio sulfuroxidans]